MEKLAGLVLNGHGDKLDGFKSDHPEIQSFLDNVPAYMVGFSLLMFNANFFCPLNSVWPLYFKKYPGDFMVFFFP